MVDIGNATLDVFTPLVGGVVTIEVCDGQTFETTLHSAVERPGATPRGARRKAFTLFLNLPAPFPFREANLTLVHPSFGRLGPVYAGQVYPRELGSDLACIEVSFN